MPPFSPLRVDLLPERNVLRFVVGPSEPGEAIPADAMIDVGERGALLGIELRPASAFAALRLAAADIDAAGAVYLPIAPEMSGPHDRSVAVTVDMRPGLDGALVAVDLPRRGAGYEITYPGGNQ